MENVREELFLGQLQDRSSSYPSFFLAPGVNCKGQDVIGRGDLFEICPSSEKKASRMCVSVSSDNRGAPPAPCFPAARYTTDAELLAMLNNEPFSVKQQGSGDGLRTDFDLGVSILETKCLLHIYIYIHINKGALDLRLPEG